ncbi:MAG: hypothetical protein R3344_09530 [Acidobacteriota bacterium]|nr:hypothetical protein [Acidobacteriota bacterium]
MSVEPLKKKPRRVARLQDRALDDLRYIRDTMERAGAFTHVSGWGQVFVGATALVAAWVASTRATPGAWLATWLTGATAAFVIAGVSTHQKARAAGESLFSAPGRKFTLSFVPAMVLGAVLTAVLYRAEMMAALPGMWLMVYGTAVVACGAFSVRVVPVMGLAFMAVGAAAFAAPVGWGDIFMAIGFGGLHLIFGAIVARKYGG